MCHACNIFLLKTSSSANIIKLFVIWRKLIWNVRNQPPTQRRVLYKLPNFFYEAQQSSYSTCSLIIYKLSHMSRVAIVYLRINDYFYFFLSGLKIILCCYAWGNTKGIKGSSLFIWLALVSNSACHMSKSFRWIDERNVKVCLLDNSFSLSFFTFKNFSHFFSSYVFMLALDYAHFLGKNYVKILCLDYAFKKTPFTQFTQKFVFCASFIVL